MVTIRDIAEHSGYNVGTVSRALRGDRSRVSAQALEVIQRAAQELGYDPDTSHMARRMILHRFGKRMLNHVIAVLLPPQFSTMPYFFALYKGMLDVLSAENYGVLTVCVVGQDSPLPPSFARGDVDAVITTGPISTEVLARLGYDEQSTSSRVPLVMVRGEAPGVSSIVEDSVRSAYLVARHMLERGHRHLLHFLEHFPQSHWLTGYRQAYQEFGLDPEYYLHGAHFEARAHDPEATDWVWAILHAALERWPEITGILALNDLIALQIYRALLVEGGIQVPRDISLVGCDDTHVITDAHQQNILTTVHLPLAEMGETAARQALQLVHGTAEPEQHIVLPVSLVERASTRAIAPVPHR
jgi:LacI family transcriptional regulator